MISSDFKWAATGINWTFACIIKEPKVDAFCPYCNHGNVTFNANFFILKTWILFSIIAEKNVWVYSFEIEKRRVFALFRISLLRKVWSVWGGYVDMCVDMCVWGGVFVLCVGCVYVFLFVCLFVCTVCLIWSSRAIIRHKFNTMLATPAIATCGNNMNNVNSLKKLKRC